MPRTKPLAPGTYLLTQHTNVTVPLHPGLFAPCSWKLVRGQRFTVTGCLRWFGEQGWVRGSEKNDVGGYRMLRVEPGDYVLRGEGDEVDVVNEDEFRLLVRKARVVYDVK